MARTAIVLVAAFGVADCQPATTCVTPRIVHHEAVIDWLPVGTNPPVIAPVERPAFDERVCGAPDQAEAA